MCASPQRKRWQRGVVERVSFQLGDAETAAVWRRNIRRNRLRVCLLHFPSKLIAAHDFIACSNQVDSWA